MDRAVDDFEFDDDRYGRVGSGTTVPSVHYVNETGLHDELILNDATFNREVASVIERWSNSLSPQRTTTSLDVFARDRWSGARHPFAQMSQCAFAVENDDVLSTLAEVTEGLTFKKMRFELNDDDQQDVWNQWGRVVDLDSHLRAMFRDLFKFSQVIVGMWWEDQIYKVRDNPVTSADAEVNKLREAIEQNRQAQLAGDFPDAPGQPSFTPPVAPTGPGRGNRRRKKSFAVKAPSAFTIFDPTKVMPVGMLMFGRERFAYIADREEDQAFQGAIAGKVVDPVVMQLVERKYSPSAQDKAACADLGVDSSRLWLLQEGTVFRHTLTRAQYERFAAIRLKPALELIELKAHQRASDRAALIGNTNFIVVITKGSDRLPASPPEIENLKEQARVIARLPVLVGDHRLEVKIVAPPLDHTLQESRWQVLDARLVFIALRSFMPIVQGGNSSTGVSEMGRVVAQGLENRRHMLVRSLERFVFGVIMDRNQGVLSEDPTLAFAPKRVTLDFQSDVVSAILKLRDRGDLSRETTLDEFDYDQDTELVRRAREGAYYDDIFKSGVPHDSPNRDTFKSGSSPEGGRPAGVQESKPRQPKGATKV